MTLALRRHGGVDAALLVAGLGAATELRVIVGRPLAPASVPAGLLFAGLVGGLALAAGWRPARPAPRSLASGLGGAAVLIVGALLRHQGTVAVQPSMWLVTVWMPSVALVAAAEEMLIRGALFDRVQQASSPAAATLVTAAVFAVIHVPLYGAAALPLDLAAGLLLSSLRLHTGGVAAPLTAHVLADWMAPWV